MGRILEADIESFSDVDLVKCGVYAYADSPAFEILLFAYSFDGGETQIIDLAQGEKFPAEVEEAIFDVSVTKTAYNANFERTCLSSRFRVRFFIVSMSRRVCSRQIMEEMIPTAIPPRWAAVCEGSISIDARKNRIMPTAAIHLREKAPIKARVTRF